MAGEQFGGDRLAGVEELSGFEELGGVEGIAVVGMAGRFPGADGVDAFWANLRAGVESIRRLSPDELREAGVDPALAAHPDYVPARGTVDGIEWFDAAFFGIPPREAEVTDPQHRLFLEVAWEALERAGMDPSRAPGRVGVYAGCGMNTYAQTLNSFGRLAKAVGGMAAMVGNDKDYLATRVAYKLGLTGPAVLVQSACSTSLVAVHLAVQSLLSYQCDVALAGGVSLLLPQGGYLWQQGSIGSRDGHCRAFDARASGTVMGGGAGVVVLRRLEDALADGDPVIAVIRGSAINNDGAAKVGYTAPSVEGQAQVIAEAQSLAGVSADTITYVEAHGTGTELGDPIEVAALTQAFRAGGAEGTGFCALGSAKTNIGHLDAAAGVTGLIKTSLALHHGEIPPSLHWESPNPSLGLATSPFFVAQKLSKWSPPAGVPRRAGVSSFGLGGTNAHVVMEQAPPRAASRPPSRAAQLLVLSARTETALATMAERLRTHLEQTPEQPLADVAWTLQRGRRGFAHRMAVVAHDRADAVRALAGDRPSRTVDGRTGTHAPSVVFLFPGQGAQHPGMARGLYEDEPVFRAEMDRCAAILRPLMGIDPWSAICSGDGDALMQAAFQPLLFAVEYATARQWMAWGIQPDAMLGHSLGEYVAACLAGVFSLEDALALVAERGRLMQSTPPGAMLAVPLPPAEVEPMLDGSLSIATISAPDRCVVAGPPDEVARLQAALRARGVDDAKQVATARASHSMMMDPVLDAFTARVAATVRNPPALRWVSNVTGTWITPAEAVDPAYWARHLRGTVRLADCFATLAAEGRERVFIEAGPGRTLSSLVKRQVPGCTAVNALRHPRDPADDVETLLAALGRAWAAGVEPDWAAVHGGDARRRVVLPTYPFERRRFWMDSREAMRAGEGAARDPDDPAERFWAPAWKESHAPAAAPAAGTRVLVLADGLGLDDGLGLGERVAARLRDAGAFVAVAETGAAFARAGDERWRLDPARADDYHALLAELAQADALPVAILHLWSLDGDGDGEDGVHRRGVRSIRLLSHALVVHAAGCPVRLVAASHAMHDVAGGELPRADRMALLSAGGVLAAANPAAIFRTVDVEVPASRGGMDALAARLAAEALDPRADGGTVAYRGRRRWIRETGPLRLDGAPAASGGLYLFTGGASVDAVAAARALARIPGAVLLLCGAGWTADGVRHLRGLGAGIIHHPADPADAAALRALADEAARRHGPVRGIVAAADLRAGADFEARDLDDADPPALTAARVVDEAFAEGGPDWLIYTSALPATAEHGALARLAALAARAEARAARTGERVLCAAWDALADASAEPHALSMADAEDAVARLLAAAPAGQVIVSRRDPRLHRDLPAPAPASAEVTSADDDATDPPAGGAVATLAGIWRALLGVERVRPDDGFFALGGDSVIAIQVVSRAARAGLRLTTRQVFVEPTLAALAAAATVEGVDGAPAAEQGPVVGPVRLTPPQRALLDADPPRPEQFGQSIMIELRQPVEPAALEGAVARILEHHDALRLRFTRGADGWRAENAAPGGPIPFTSVDLSAHPPAEQERTIRARAAEAQAALSLDSGSLLTSVHFALGPDRPARWFVAAHPLAVDGISWRVLLEDLETCVADGDARLPARGTAYRDWAARLEEHAASGALDAEGAWWARTLRPGAAALPVDDPAAADTYSAERTRSVWLDADETDVLLHRLPASFAIQPHEVLIAALARALGDWAGGSQVLMELRTHGREAPFADVDLSRTVGSFACGFPVRLALPDGGGGAVLRAVQEQLRAVPGRGQGYGVLRHLRAGPAGEALRARPEPRVSFHWIGTPDQAWTHHTLFGPGAGGPPPLHPADAPRPFALEVSAIVVEGRLRADLTHGASHRPETVQALADAWLRTLRAMMSHVTDARDGGFTPAGPGAAPAPDEPNAMDETDGVLAGREGPA
jgi:non-ribosomal peptide synthase protein (TIGR01720 family)